MLKISTFRGTANQLSAAYAAYFQREIAGFFSQEFGTYRESKWFVRDCLMPNLFVLEATP